MKPYQPFAVYILSNFTRTVLFIGVTNNLLARVQEHKDNIHPGFTSKYRCHFLMYFEQFDYIENAIRREKQLKNWHRQWKMNLILQHNPDLNDLYPSLFPSP